MFCEGDQLVIELNRSAHRVVERDNFEFALEHSWRLVTDRSAGNAQYLEKPRPDQYYLPLEDVEKFTNKVQSCSSAGRPNSLRLTSDAYSSSLPNEA